MEFLLALFGLLAFPWVESPLAIALGIVSALGMGFISRDWAASVSLKSLGAGSLGTAIYLVSWLSWEYFYRQPANLGWSLITIPLMAAAYIPLMSLLVWASLLWR